MFYSLRSHVQRDKYVCTNIERESAFQPLMGLFSTYEQAFGDAWEVQYWQMLLYRGQWTRWSNLSLHSANGLSLCFSIYFNEGHLKPSQISIILSLPADKIVAYQYEYGLWATMDETKRSPGPRRSSGPADEN